MKAGLLLLQSISPSALRSGRRGCTTARRWSTTASASSARKTSGAFLATLAACSSGATVAMCNSNAGNDRGAMTATTRSPADTGAAAATRTTKFDEPEIRPERHPLLPFPESSLKYDTYNGVTLDLTSIVTENRHSATALDAETFGVRLGQALEIWTAEQKKGIWLKIPTAHAHLIAPATRAHGFDFQHAEAGFCVLTRWLPTASASRLPGGPTHQVGIGALVVHPVTGEMLAVQERAGPAAKRKLWKMPTGLTDPGENVAAAAVRELREETGLDCTFERVVCFRQAHGGLFGRSDMFFVCLCRLAPAVEARLRRGEGEVALVPQEEEILEAQWMPMEEYANQGVWKESPFYQEMNAAMMHAAKGMYGDGAERSHGFVGKHLPVGYRPGSDTIYVSSQL